MLVVSNQTARLLRGLFHEMISCSAVVPQDHLTRMLGQFQRGGAARVRDADDKSLHEPKASPMKQPPTERERAIAQRRAEGRTLQRIAKEFGGLTPETVRGICRRVEEFDRATAMLRDNPASIEALGLIGEVSPSVQHTLRSKGINQLTDLEGVTMDQLLTWPRVGKQSATSLLEALANLKRTE